MIKLHVLLTFLIFFCFLTPSFAYKLRPGDELITNFETQPFNNFGGSIGTYGAHSGSGFNNKYAHNGYKSYRLVFSKDAILAEAEHYVNYEPLRTRIKKTQTITTPIKIRNLDWAVFILDMGPIADMTKEPIKIKPADISLYRYLVFWVKGRDGGEDFRVYLRDIHAGTYDPQLKIKPHIVVQKRWKPVVIDLRKIKSKIDLANIVQIGIGFGREDGNKRGNIMYVDNFVLVK